MLLQVEHGDLRDILPQFPEACIDSGVSDPPYELGFMNKAWDSSGVAFDPDTWRHVYRVLKPGAYLCAFGGTRTWHRIAVAIEDAGFEIRDSLAWLYGQGFPKSHDISKSLDKAAGAERKVIGQQRLQGNAAVSTKDKGGTYTVGCGLVGDKMIDITAPATELAQKWEGWGTALKPSFEPIILARKPPVGTIAANVAAYGVGGLNIGACRTPASAADVARAAVPNPLIGVGGKGGIYDMKTGVGRNGEMFDMSAGRWPPNVCVDEMVAEDLDATNGVRTSGKMKGGTPRATRQGVAFGKMGASTGGETHGDSGGVSRYFYCPKANGKERDAGLEAAGWPVLTGGEMTDRDEGAPGATNPRSGAGRGGQRRNPHPTVKPLELMRWLCKLVTPPGGIILDPFTGSGTTGCAAALEGFQFAGVELIELHAKLARDRIAYWAGKRAA